MALLCTLPQTDTSCRAELCSVYRLAYITNNHYNHETTAKEHRGKCRAKLTDSFCKCCFSIVFKILCVYSHRESALKSLKHKQKSGEKSKVPQPQIYKSVEMKPHFHFFHTSQMCRGLPMQTLYLGSVVSYSQRDFMFYPQNLSNICKFVSQERNEEGHKP